MTRTKISTVTNKGVKISCKEVTTQLFTVVGLLVEIITSIKNQRVLLWQIFPLGNSVKITHNCTVMSSFIFSSFYLRITLQYHL